MISIQFGFNPNILFDINRAKRRLEQLRTAIKLAKDLKLDVIEFSCTRKMFQQELEGIFTHEIIDEIQKAKKEGIKFNVHAFYGAGKKDVRDVYINHVDPEKREEYLSMLLKTFEFFQEAIQPNLYVIHSGRAYKRDKKRQMDCLVDSIEKIDELMGIKYFAIENGRRNTLLEHETEIVALLERTKISFVYDVMLGFRSICREKIYEEKRYEVHLSAISNYASRVAEIHWSDTRLERCDESVLIPTYVLARATHLPLGDGDIPIEMIIKKLGEDLNCINLIEQLPTGKAQIEKSLAFLKKGFRYILDSKFN